METEIQNENLESKPRSIWKSREESALQDGVVFPKIEYPELIKKFLFARRLVSTHEIEILFQPKLSALKDPFLILDMEKAVDRLLQSLKSNEKICVYADFDLDGTSGLALLSEGLRALGFQNLVLYQPKRLANGYGFHAASVRELAEQNVSLIITVDVGITANETVAVANELKIDVILTDHHQPAAQLPKAFAVVNPNRLDDQSALGYLCGAGVAFYLLRALMKKMSDAKMLGPDSAAAKFDLKSVLDFFTIGTLTDMVPLVEDNRVLVKHGLVKLSQTQRPGFRVLLDELGLAGRSLSAQDVGIRFAPKLNALSRMEKGILPIDIMLEVDLVEAQNKVEFIIENNDDRVLQQSEGEKEALDSLTSWKHDRFFYFSSKNIHRGVAGLIATKLCQQTGKPSFIGSQTEDGIIVGSARAPQRSSESVLKALNGAAAALNRFGGHHAASGFELFVSSEINLIQALHDHFETSLQNHEHETIEYDFDLSLSQITEGFMKWIEALGPFGQAFQTPLFRIQNVKVSNIYKLRGGHLKLSITDGNEKMDALYFSPPMHQTFSKGDLVNILFELQWNYYQGQRTVQLLVKDLQCHVEV